nr:E3 ubiquitin-protein ligase LubX [Chlamydiota bacterium]
MSAVSSNSYEASQIRHPHLGESPPTFICPITDNIMADPVIDKHGHSFERAAILEWLKINNTCPMNRQPLTPDDLAPN